jgi:hypothetical protein
MAEQLDLMLSKHLKRLGIPERQWPEAKKNLLDFGKNVLAIESTNDYGAINKKSGAKGGYQFLDNSIAPAVTRLRRDVPPQDWMNKVSRNKDARTLTPKQQDLLVFADWLNKTVGDEVGRGDRYLTDIAGGDQQAAIKMYYEAHHTDPKSQKGTTARARAQFGLPVENKQTGGIVSNMYNPRQQGSADMVDKRQLTDYENYGGTSEGYDISADQYYNRHQNPKTALPRNRFPFNEYPLSPNAEPPDFFEFDRNVTGDEFQMLRNARMEAVEKEDQRRIQAREKAYAGEPRQASGAPIDKFMGRDFVPHPSLENPVQEFATNEAKLRQGMQQDSPNVRKYGPTEGFLVDKRMQETGESELQAVSSLLFRGEISLEAAEKSLLNDPTVMDRDSARSLQQNNPEEYARIMKEQDQAQQLFFDRMRGRDADGYFPSTMDRLRNE